MVLPSSIDTLVCSTGGVGSTLLLKEISKYKVTNLIKNEDGYKHLIVPPVSPNINAKFIFVFGNPIDSVLSLFRRGIHYEHSKTMLYFNSKIMPVNRETTLEQYSREGIDRFLFEEQFNNWLSGSKFYPTLFIKYEKMWDNLEMIYDFIGIPKEWIEVFPEKKPRHSDFDKLDEETRDNLKNIYGDFERYLEDFDDCLIVNKNKRRLLPGMLFTKSGYYIARKFAGNKIKDLSPYVSKYLERLIFSKRS